VTTRFLVDAMLPPKFVRWLNGNGFEARRTTSLGIAGTSDESIWKVACSTGEIVISRDKDFIALSKTSSAGKVVLYKQGNSNFEQIIREFKANREAIDTFITSKEVLLNIN
jgi:predicted nuclease of predicted toxin-antitoxin system